MPEQFARLTITREGDPGRAWVEKLPSLIEEFLQRWVCTPTGSISHGQVGVVIPVRRRDGTRAVLKISFPHPGNVLEPACLAAWNGRGAVRIYARDDSRFAMLLEWAGPGGVARLSDDEAITVCGELTRRLAIPAPPGFPPNTDPGDEWKQPVRKNSLPDATIAAAEATLRELGASQPATLMHGDLHYGNVLGGGREPWLAIDPKGVVGDPAREGFTALVGGIHRLLDAGDVRKELLRRLSIFADAAHIEVERVTRWAQVRCVKGFQRAYAGGATWEADVTGRLAVLLTRDR